VEVRGKLFMVDCGEGTQVQLRKSHQSFTRISTVFITHLHCDHCFGLIGMISTFGLMGRTAPLHIYAPEEMEKLLDLQSEMFLYHLTYEVVFHAIDTTQQAVIYEDRSVSVTTIPLKHRIPCCGFLFQEKPTLPHIRREKIDFYQIPLSQIDNIKNGADWVTEEGKVIPNHELTIPAEKPSSYAYCSDTRYIPYLYKQLSGVNLLYHESTYAEDMKDRAIQYNHSTARDAAQVARDAHAGKLLLGHYSARYEDENILLQEARAVFPNSFLTNEGDCIEVESYEKIAPNS
jgi:ribonuclease Z